MSYIQNDGYVVYDEASDDDDDDDESESSDEDEESFWRGFEMIEASRTARRNRQPTTDADDFEAQMNRELDNTISTMHGSRSNELTGSGDGAVSGPSSSSSNKQKEVKFYDDAYFDSDSDGSQPPEEDKPTRKRRSMTKHPVLSNDDLLYDPDADDADQRWVDRRRNRLAESRPPPVSASSSTTSNHQPAPTSDAVLNCPACMTTLCRDCQRHDMYKGQYRAMFVSNCKVDSEHTLKYPMPRVEKRKRTSGGGDDESYNPVHCGICNTHVAVYDTDEVYHFFNVLASFG